MCAQEHKKNAPPGAAKNGPNKTRTKCTGQSVASSKTGSNKRETITFAGAGGIVCIDLEVERESAGV